MSQFIFTFVKIRIQISFIFYNWFIWLISLFFSFPCSFSFSFKTYSLKKLGYLNCSISHNLDFANCIPVVLFSKFLCPLCFFFKLVVEWRASLSAGLVPLLFLFYLSTSQVVACSPIRRHTILFVFLFVILTAVGYYHLDLLFYLFKGCKTTIFYHSIFIY